MGQKNEEDEDDIAAQGEADDEDRGDADESEDSSDEDGSDLEEDDSDEDDSDEDDSDDLAASGDDDESEDNESDSNEETALAARVGDDLADHLGEEGEEEELPTQLGSTRFVFGAFFSFAIAGAYILGRAIHGLWAHFANRDFFVDNLPALASVSDEGKETYAMAIGALIALIVTFRAYRRPRIHDWSTAVSAELVKVKWPNRKEVQSSTIVVLAASAIATTYLFLLDRFWGFVTDKIYGGV